VLEGQEGHNQDINNYLESALRIGTSAAAQKIRKDLQEKSLGVFMWVVLVVDILNEEYDGGRMYALERRLKQIPADLHDLFQDILTRDSNDKEELILCIQWVLFAKQPLKPEQLYHAILAGIEPDALTSQHYQEVTADTIRRFLLRSSKGLTEITKSKNTKVQFIHESVRDFLLKENGLSKIWPEFTSNFQGQSHERLKQCCYSHISIDVATPLKLPDTLPKASLPESADLRRSAAETFPFLEYAVHNVLYHADTAESTGISQAKFLDSFPLLQWVKLHNLFEKHQVRRHTRSVSLLYMLAELNTANLIQVLGSASCCMHVEDERYGCPLLAAVTMSNEEATEVLLESIEVQPEYTNLIAAVDRRQFQHKPDRRTTRRGLTYSNSKDVLGNALDYGYDRVIARAIASGKFQIDSQNSSAKKILLWASSNGSETLAKSLLVGDPTLVDSRDFLNRTPLFLAAMEGSLEVIEVLLEAGADIDANRHDDNALCIAISRGRKEIVALLLDKGANVNASTGSNNNAISVASSQGNKEMINLLLAKGANVNPMNAGCCAALQQASAKGHKEIVELLISRGADVNAQGRFYGTGIQAASHGGHKEILKLLLDKGADVNVQGGLYGNALQAASACGQKETVEFLLDKGANVNAKGGMCNTALQAASRSGRKEIVALLLDKGADINAQGGDYGGALGEASTSGHKKIVELLLDKGADIGDAVEKTSAFGYKEIVELLLDKGADVGNALEKASAFGYKDIVKLLLERGANVANALQAASDRGQTDMVALLQKHSVAGSSK
jgi:ankyrin repeat protein